MMASRMFQSIILQMKDAVDRTIGIINASGAVVACTDLKRIGEMREDAAAELPAPEPELHAAREQAIMAARRVAMIFFMRGLSFCSLFPTRL